MVVARVAAKNPHEVAFVQDDDMVEALSPDRSDQTFIKRILPRRGGGRDDFLDAHRLDTPDELSTEDTVTVTKQIARCGIVGKGVTHLLGGPPSRRRGRDVEVQDATPVVGHDEENDRTRNVNVGTTKTSIATTSLRWLSKNARQL